MKNTLSLGEKMELLIELKRNVSNIGFFISHKTHLINKSPVSIYDISIDNVKYSITRNVDADSAFWTIRNLETLITTKRKSEWDLPYFQNV